ncbi:MAG: hypothetical protein HY841_06465 [Bacteroidetes bacterium]|nr:hypothetical protein [Bacteroidota bacterium]
MKILINDHRKIYAIQKEFSKIFPYLKLQFFGKPHKVGAPSSKKIMKHPSKTIGQCRVIHNKGKLTITPTMSVSDLEQGFSDVYGLSVQVFRQSGRVWLKATATDDWTLESQNRQGKELSEYYEKKYLKENEAAE